jgi:succinate dehydrogenase / fumarate reductase flavoprotein subunit
MTTIPGLYALGEANFADHGANRLGANSLLQACVDGYFIAPATIPNYLAGEIKSGPVSVDHPAFAETEEAALRQLQQLLGIQGTAPSDHFHKALGTILYDKCGLSRSRAGLE